MRDRARPTRLGAPQPALLPQKQLAHEYRAPRPALADVSNRDHNQVSYTYAPHKPPAKDAARLGKSARAELAAHDIPTSHESACAPDAVVPILAAETADLSMRTDAWRPEQRDAASDTEAQLPASQSASFELSASHSSGSLRSDDSEALAVLGLDVDPAGIVTLPLDLELDAQRRVADICERYGQSVLLPQAYATQAERHELVQLGQLDRATAAHDDEMMRLGLDPEEARDASMVAEYADDIFEYMACCERESMPNPNYMDFQDEIQWHMRTTLVDWLLQVHMRYHMLPETLWIAVNLVDRFLSARIVSLAKLQLVGVTAMFIASKYEEILAPSVEEFVFMTENGYSREEILKGERIVLSTLDFTVSTYCSPYSWVRRISKADDYDIQTRTLCKFLMEVTLLSHLFLRARPSLIAAIGMYLAKRMLGGAWDDAFVYYSRFTEEQLIPGTNLLLEKLIEPGFEEQFVFKKYASKKFLKASMYARSWALRNHHELVAAQTTEYVYAPHSAS
ncbi:B-type cyclin [Malassezia vespertilionis]|nr:B-type cyclin [Malassezia vespertilionis]WFD06089.1 B-type cyclin [Malassezia vespertilionis]